MCMVLLREPVRFSQVSLARCLEGILGDDEWSLETLKGNGALVELRIGERRFSVLSMPAPIPPGTLTEALDQPHLADLRPVVDAHKGHIAITSRDAVGNMSEAFLDALAVHILSWRLGGSDAPLASYWSGSGWLQDWTSFAADAEKLLSSLETDPPAYPARFWVSISLRRDGDLHGGTTRGLAAFTGYEIDMTPIAWPLESVAERLTQTVDYVLEKAPILLPDQTLGVSAEEKFRISLDEAGAILRLTLEDNAS